MRFRFGSVIGSNDALKGNDAELSEKGDEILEMGGSSAIALPHPVGLSRCVVVIALLPEAVPMQSCWSMCWGK